MKTNILAASAIVLALSAAPAMAVTITEGGNAALDGSGLTTSLMGPNVFVETFDVGGGCGFTPPISAAVVTGDYSVTNTSVSGLRAAPAGDTTCYMAVPDQDIPGDATVDLGAVFISPGARINYLGLYWGSIDLYNTIDFFDVDDNLIQTLTGADILDALALAGNQSDPGSNKYINLFFDNDELFTSFRVSSSQYAFEFDNVAVRVVIDPREVPEPATLGLLGLGLLGVAGAARRKR